MAAMASISARRSTYSPARDVPASKVRWASRFPRFTGTLQKKSTLATMSRRPSPKTASAARKFSLHPATPATPYSKRLLGSLQRPPMVSCTPQVSATMANIGYTACE